MTYGGGSIADATFAATLSDASWYYWSGDAGTRMLSDAPTMSRCSTTYPGYLNSAHPGMGDPPTRGQACFTTGSACNAKTDVEPLITHPPRPSSFGVGSGRVPWYSAGNSEQV